MRVNRGPMRDVDLGDGRTGPAGPAGPDDTDDSDVTAGTTAEADQARRSRTRRRLLRWAVPSAVVVVVALVATQLYLDDRARRHVAELQQVPGVLRSLDPPLQVTGTYPTGLWVPLVSGVRAGALRVGAAAPEQGGGATSSRDLVGVDPGTGQVAWRVPLDGPDAPVPSLASPVTSPALPTCVGLGDPATRVLCHVLPGGTPVLVPGAAAPAPGDPAQATDAGAVQLLVRTADGRVEATRQVPGDSTVRLLDGVLVTAWLADDGRLHARASDPVTDATWWSFDEDSADAAPTPSDAPVLTVLPAGDQVLLSAGSRAWLLDRDGSASTPVSPLDLFAVRGGRIARISTTTTQILGEDGRVVSETPGAPAGLTVDDGSAPGLVFVSGGSVEHPGTTVLTAVEAATGRVAWQSPVPATGTLIVLDSALYSVGDGVVWSLDARTGASRWSTPLGADDGAGGLVSLLTDARHLLVALPRDGSAGSLVALDLSDGARAWSTPLPEGLVQLVGADGRLIGTRGDDLLVLG